RRRDLHRAEPGQAPPSEPLTRPLDPFPYADYAVRRSHPDALPPAEDRMASHILTDVTSDIWVDSFSLDVGPCSATKRTLRGGRRDGVDLVRLDNGAFSVDIVPTRGMGLRRGDYKGTRIGWTSAVTDGPVNPKFVNLMAWGGLGWLEGYDEMLVRC